MTTVKYATLCDIPLPLSSSGVICRARSEEYASWPSCRGCVSHVCPDHTVPGSLREHEYDRGAEAVMTQDVYCTACLAENGPEDTTKPTQGDTAQ